MSPQRSIAHYRIIAKLGEGGMGEVWRATDTKLNRDVAIKILPEVFSRDPDRMARFTREAQVLAQLNHPNIAAIYGVEERALIMELVEGETLPTGLPPEKALNYARQIAEALEYAHERGIIHRDLKPANIKVTGEGRIKVLDFGLAKAASNGATTASDPMSSPTVTIGATIAGVMLGTPSYMAPEQARGQNVDRRADIWAFGVVLYEMLTGRRLFAGETVSDTLAGVLRTEPDLTPISDEMRPIIERCLRKDPHRRWQAIGDVRVLLEDGVAWRPAAPATTRHKSIVPWMVATGALAIAIALGSSMWQMTRQSDKPLTRIDLDLGPDAVAGLNLTVAISPDGRRLVYPVRGPDGKQQLATRLLEQARATVLPGTEGGRDPFFSPDSQSIGFFSGFQLKTISVLGGAPSTLRAVSNFSTGASWGVDGSIIAAIGTAQPLTRVPVSGGVAGLLTKLDPGELTNRWPQILPGGKGVVFTASSSLNVQLGARIEAISLKNGELKNLVRGGYYGRYLPSGHLVFVRDGVLFGVPFNPDRLEVRGAPVPLLDDVAANRSTGGGQFDFSANGTFVYATGKSAAQAWQMTWLDSTGRMQPLLKVPGSYINPHISPDGHKVAFVGDGPDIYIHDLDRDTTTRVTNSGQASNPVWAPDNRHIVFRSIADGFPLYWIRSDGAGDPELLLKSSTDTAPWCFSPDGRWLAYFQSSAASGADLWVLPLDVSNPEHPKAGKPEVFLSTPANESLPRFSPDGRWIAYRSNESGLDEVYVRPFPAGNGGKSQISSSGGLYGLWSNNGHELFYETTDNQIMVVDYRVKSGALIPGKPRLWSDKRLFYSGPSNLDLAPDGKRFLVLMAPEPAPGERNPVHITMLQNFFDEVKRRIPVK
jgi:serine/threonine-protein kinase